MPLETWLEPESLNRLILAIGLAFGQPLHSLKDVGPTAVLPVALRPSDTEVLYCSDPPPRRHPLDSEEDEEEDSKVL